MFQYTFEFLQITCIFLMFPENNVMDTYTGPNLGSDFTDLHGFVKEKLDLHKKDDNPKIFKKKKGSQVMAREEVRPRVPSPAHRAALVALRRHQNCKSSYLRAWSKGLVIVVGGNGDVCG